MSKYKNDHLDCVIKSHSINLDSGILLDNYKKKRDKVKEALEKEYGSNIHKILNSGSYAKNTAINIKFDMDLCIHFKKGSFSTLEEMYDSVHGFLNTDYKKDDDDLITVRAQRVSSGLKFNVDGEDLFFDVTAGRKITEEDDNDVNLYQNVDDANSIKTNIIKQIDEIKGRAKERECIKLLKVWKFHHFSELKSFLVELLTMRAYDEEQVESTKGLWERLKKVIQFIIDNIETINLKDPGNFSNNVTDSLEEDEKQKLKNDLKTLLDKIDRDQSKIKHYFKINDKHPCAENTYDYDDSKAQKIPKPTFG